MPDRGLTKFPPPDITQLRRKYDVMVQDGDFDYVNNQEARSANIHLVKSITVFAFDGLENRGITNRRNQLDFAKSTF